MRNLIIVLLVALAVFAFQTDVIAQDGGVINFGISLAVGILAAVLATSAGSS